MDLNGVKFTSDIIKTDVTALKVLKNDILLIGIGHVAYLYTLSNQKFVLKISVFSGQKIHGFLPANYSNAVVILGGKQAKIYYLHIESSPEDQNNEGPETKVNFIASDKNLKFADWIINLIWVQSEKKIAVLTAHNVIQIWDLESNSLSSRHCEEKCILYSGLLTEIEDQLLALAGTAFSQIVIWSSHGEQVLHRISGHKGVIFSISYSKNKNVIITTSDDRSVRIWNIVSKESIEPETLEYWQSATIESQAILFGHTARVIRSIILNETIISIGEDALMCAWDFNGILLNKKKVIQGGGLWCLDHNDQNIIVTGGSNSGVILHEGFCNSPVPKSSSLNFPDDRISAKKVVLTARGNIVCITEQGYVMYYDFEIEEWSVKHEISYAKSYLCMAVSLCRQFVALAGIDGQIDIFAENCKFDPNLKHFLSQKIIDGKILSVHWVVDRCLVVCDANGEITLWGSQNETCANIARFTLPKCKERWLTAAALEPNHKKYLLAGDRCGNFHFFQKGILDPVETLSKIHGRMGINSIEFHNGKILTTERDGSIKCFTLVETNDSHKLQYLHQIKLPFVWVEHFVDRQKNIICGFQQANLVVWDIKEQSNVLSVNCGGGHRSWDLTRSWQDFENKTQNIFRFVFIKNSTVQVVQSKYQEMAFKSIVQGIHSKEINDVKIVMPSDNTGDNFYIISGGEDTSVQIASCKTQKDNLIYENLIDLTNHLSSIRCMCLSPINAKLCDSGNQEYILYSAGGRAQICASKIILRNVENNNQIESQDLGSYMLKGTDFERKKKEGGWSKLPKDVDAETRFMSLDYIIPEKKESSGLFNNILLAGCSDGFLRVYETTVNQNKCEFILQSSLEHHNRCILKVKCFNIKNNYIVLTLAVNGTVAFWDFTEFVNSCEETSKIIKPFKELKIHKAGINSVDINLLDDDQIILATGGDDNALHLNILQIKIDKNTREVDKLCEWSCDKYHCSQITGLKLFNDNIMISVSIDQRVTVIKWSCNNTKEELTCEFIAQYHTTVPDLQGFEAIKSDRKKISLCLFGKGIEVLTVDL